ncbi:periplasmic heavy metal sensor [Nitrosomonas aestuarii]|uniref:periplasmic heavy metal sensor n=1 Tax=Nitrosomonas aestuarii TaxID=52441 RepID=UPI000D306CD0|nr:periplasmic heavy metal sensor [Nitrosomonas aestuarii]PTN09127.1 putative membrane protein [Nitrosomonas aestuarii]
MSKKLKLFILISVILNVILIGIIAGYSFQHFGLERGDEIISLLDNSSLPEEKRNSLKKKLRDVLPNENKRKDKQEWRDKTLAILTAKEFDVDAYRAQLEKRRVERSQNKNDQIEIMTELVSQLNQDERKELAKIFRKNRRFVN